MHIKNNSKSIHIFRSSRVSTWHERLWSTVKCFKMYMTVKYIFLLTAFQFESFITFGSLFGWNFCACVFSLWLSILILNFDLTLYTMIPRKSWIISYFTIFQKRVKPRIIDHYPGSAKPLHISPRYCNNLYGLDPVKGKAKRVCFS